MGNRIVFTGGVCDTLIELGEKFMHIRPDLKDSTKNIFVFKDSPTFAANLREAIVRQLKEQGKEIYN